jgi:hypothetical protein
MIFYMLIATVIVAISLNEALELYLHDIMGERIVGKILDSTTFVHKADIDRTGDVSEAEFIMFKLQQMQKVDTDLLNRLIDRFEQMDNDNNRMLIVGLHIPNPKQVEEMKREIQGTSTTMVEAWKLKRDKMRKLLGYDENNVLLVTPTVSQSEHFMDEGGEFMLEGISSVKIRKSADGAGGNGEFRAKTIEELEESSRDRNKIIHHDNEEEEEEEEGTSGLGDRVNSERSQSPIGGPIKEISIARIKEHPKENDRSRLDRLSESFILPNLGLEMPTLSSASFSSPKFSSFSTEGMTFSSSSSSSSSSFENYAGMTSPELPTLTSLSNSFKQGWGTSL